ncbi:hypothetical protein FRC17_005648 [Serendipita sp. 399]|nr:hypothetical protein FRC17_005648 [Serendipita sp. 399]
MLIAPFLCPPPYFNATAAGNLAIKLPRARKLALLLATTVDKKVTSLGNAPRRQKQKLAINAVRKVTFPVNAPSPQVTLTREEVDVTTAAQSAIAVAKLDISLVTAPAPVETVMVVVVADDVVDAVDMVAIAIAMAAAMKEEEAATLLLAAETKRLGGCTCSGSFHLLTTAFGFSFSCGGVGHISRECVQGAKCYNCSGTGHVAKDCPQPQRKACYSCGSEGQYDQQTRPYKL